MTPCIRIPRGTSAKWRRGREDFLEGIWHIIGSITCFGSLIWFNDFTSGSQPCLEPIRIPHISMWLWFDGGMTPQFCWDNRSRTFQVTYVHFSRHTHRYIYIYTRYIYIYYSILYIYIHGSFGIDFAWNLRWWVKIDGFIADSSFHLLSNLVFAHIFTIQLTWIP